MERRTHLKKKGNSILSVSVYYYKQKNLCVHLKNNFKNISMVLKIGFHPENPSSLFRLSVMYKMGPEELKIIVGFWASLELLKQMFFLEDIWHCAKDARLSSHCAKVLRAGCVVNCLFIFWFSFSCCKCFFSAEFFTMVA